MKVTYSTGQCDMPTKRNSHSSDKCHNSTMAVSHCPGKCHMSTRSITSLGQCHMSTLTASHSPGRVYCSLGQTHTQHDSVRMYQESLIPQDSATCPFRLPRSHAHHECLIVHRTVKYSNQESHTRPVSYALL